MTELIKLGFKGEIMKILLASLLIATSSYVSAACEAELKNDKTQVSWTAFKTPKKAGVGAKFDKFEINSKDKSSIEAAIKTATFTIDTSSVNSGNPARDKTIVENFFTKNGKAVELKGEVKNVKKDLATASFSFNGVSKDVPLIIQKTGNGVTLSGKINVLDFSLDPQLKALNDACKTLHEGVTWPDVEVKITSEFEIICK